MFSMTVSEPGMKSSVPALQLTGIPNDYPHVSSSLRYIATSVGNEEQLRAETGAQKFKRRRVYCTVQYEWVPADFHAP